MSVWNPPDLSNRITEEQIFSPIDPFDADLNSICASVMGISPRDLIIIAEASSNDPDNIPF